MDWVSVGCMVLVIVYWFSIVCGVYCIVVMVDGCVWEVGIYEEFLKKGGLYVEFIWR